LLGRYANCQKEEHPGKGFLTHVVPPFLVPPQRFKRAQQRLLGCASIFREEM